MTDHWDAVRNAQGRAEFVEAVIDAIRVEIVRCCLSEPAGESKQADEDHPKGG